MPGLRKGKEMEEKEVVIRIRHLSKEYRLGVIGRGTLQRDLQSWWARKRGKPDPNQRIGRREYTSKECFYALEDVSFDVHRGERIGVIGANGAGKSTLANVILNNPEYTKTSGTVEFEGENINDLSTDKIAKKGIFMSFQLPEEIPGISVTNFLKYAKNKVTGKPVKIFEFKDELKKYMEDLNMNPKNMERSLNVGFSGGEKKKNEILQMLVLNPKLAILDETDSGLDVDAIKTVSKGIEMFKNDENAVLIITHNNKILHSLKVDYVHVLVDGKIVATGTQELATEIEENGYSKYKKMSK